LFLLVCSFHLCPRVLHSFPTRRSSDLRQYLTESLVLALAGAALGAAAAWYGSGLLLPFFRHPNTSNAVAVQPDHTVFLVSALLADRKSTRLNSSHEWISYAVSCLKKKI